MNTSLHPPSTPPPTYLSIGDVVFVKLGTVRPSYLKQMFKTYKHLKPIDILKQFGISDRVAKDIKNNTYFYIDPNVIGYIASEPMTAEAAEQQNLKVNQYGDFMLGYSIRFEMLNKKMLSANYNTFMFHHSLLSISDIVIYEPHELYEEIMNEKGNG